MDDIKQRFDRYFATLDEDDPLRETGILDLGAAKYSAVRDLAKAFADIRAEINRRFEINARKSSHLAVLYGFTWTTLRQGK